MGLKEYVAILEKMFEVCPSAFHESMPWLNRGYTIIDDGLMRLRFVVGPNVKRGSQYAYQFTGLQFKELFAGVIYDALRGNCSTWVQGFDIAGLVPREKEPEQKKRTQTRKKADKKDPSKAWKRYSHDVQICDEGVRNADGSTEMFDIRGIMSHQVTRDKAIHYVIGKLANEPLPPGTQIILDFEEAGPLQIVRCPGTGRNGVFRLDAWTHLFGETDQQIALWTWLFRNTDVEIRSGDTDTLAVVGAMIENAARATLKSQEEEDRKQVMAAVAKIFPKQIMWNRGALRGSNNAKERASVKAKTKRLLEAQARGRRLEEKAPEPARTHHKPIDVKAIVVALLQLGLTMKAIILILCHGMGSDFNEKGALAEQTGVSQIWVHLLRHKQTLAQLEWHNSSLTQRGLWCIWDRLLGEPAIAQSGYIYTHKECKPHDDDDKGFNEACRELVAFWDSAPRRACSPSSDERKLKGALMCLWGTQYWMFPFDSIVIEPPSPFANVEEWKFA